jgi:two-component system, chemotaxis family, chemotaxis protein CheY
MAGLERLHVLVVDDNPHMRAIVVAILRGAGFANVKEASDGAHALEEMRASVSDIVIIDLNMSPIDGLEFTQMIRKSPDSPSPYVPVIMMTGHTERSKVMAARDAGINEFVAKPISAKTLLDRIVSVIDKPRAFVKAKGYTGPCRRRGKVKDFGGPWRRKSDPQTQNQMLPTGPQEE